MLVSVCPCVCASVSVCLCVHSCVCTWVLAAECASVCAHECRYVWVCASACTHSCMLWVGYWSACVCVCLWVRISACKCAPHPRMQRSWWCVLHSPPLRMLILSLLLPKSGRRRRIKHRRSGAKTKSWKDLKPSFPKLAAYQTGNKPGFVLFPALNGGRTVWSHIGSDRRADSKPGNLKLLKPKAAWRQQNVMKGKKLIWEAGRGGGETFLPRGRDEEKWQSSFWET